jgi:uncharacterized protein YndB with AHSA1/START domain
MGFQTPMKMKKSAYISITSKINSEPLYVWNAFTDAKYIVLWNFASAEWHCPKATSNVKVGGVFNYRMESRDGSMGFDLKGTYTKVDPYKAVKYTLEDGRKVEVTFEENCGATEVTQRFEPDSENTPESQTKGWQAILNQFKEYVQNSL